MSIRAVSSAQKGFFIRERLLIITCTIALILNFREFLYLPTQKKGEESILKLVKEVVDLLGKMQA